MRKVILSTLFFVIAPAFLSFCVLFYSFLTFQKNNTNLVLHANSAVAFAALPGMENSFKAAIIEQKDVRIETVRDFLNKYGSELEPYSEEIVKASDKYNLDFRLLPAIAMQESNLCKKAPKESYNCWGFGMYGKKVTKFDGYADAIETVTKILFRDYISLGLKTPEEIMKKYTPSNNGAWAESVKHFMNQLQLE